MQMKNFYAENTRFFPEKRDRKYRKKEAVFPCLQGKIVIR